MPLPLRIVFTAFIVTVGIVLCTVGRSWFCGLYHDPSRWVWGESDPFRFTFFDRNGDIRRLPLCIFYGVLLALLWLQD